MNDARFSRPRTSSRAYLFASGKGGSGKSTLSAGIAAALAMSGKRVVAWDADLLMRNLDIYTGLYEHALFEHLHGLVSIGKSVRPDAVKPTNEFRRRFRPENRIDEHDYIGGIDLLLLCKNIRSNFRIIPVIGIPKVFLLCHIRFEIHFIQIRENILIP